MFVPFHDHNSLRHIRVHYVTLSLIAANVVVFIVLQAGGAEGATAILATAFGVIPREVMGFTAPTPGLFPESITLGTYMFIHGGWLHLLGNMLFLWVFGDNVEDALGHFRFLVFYFLCGICAGLTHVALDPISGVPLVGASGAVAGVIAAYLILHPRVRVWVLVLWRIPLRLSAMWVLGSWVAMQFFAVVFPPGDNVAWWSHVGGLVVGAVLVIVLRRPGVPLFDRGLPR